jgi:hypothetical protein
VGRIELLFEEIEGIKTVRLSVKHC